MWLEVGGSGSLGWWWEAGLVKFLLLEFVVHSVKSRCRIGTNIGVVPL